MSPRDFLDLADELLAGTREADWRSAVSRAYYAAYHAALALLRQVGFRSPGDGTEHVYVSHRLTNSGRAEIERAGRALSALRQNRTRADYRLELPFTEEMAASGVELALDIVHALEDLAAAPAVLARVVAAIRDYEGDVLQAVTWRQPPT